MKTEFVLKSSMNTVKVTLEGYIDLISSIIDCFSEYIERERIELE